MQTRISRWGRFGLVCTLVLTLFAAPALGADEKPFCDVNTVEPVKPWLQWLVGVGFAIGCLLLAFKNPHRSHLD